MAGNNISAKKISSTLIVSIVAMSINYIISLVLTSYVTEHLGAETYGFVILAKNISNYAIIFTSCLNAYASRYITIAYHENNIQKASIYFSSVFYANVFLSFVILMLAGVGIIYVDKLLMIPNDLLAEVKILLLLDFLNYMFLTTGSCFCVYAFIEDKLEVMNTIKLFSYVAEALVMLCLFAHLKPSIVYVGLGLLISSIVYTVGNLFAEKRYVPTLKIKHTLFKLNAVKDLVLSGIWNAINSVGNILQTGLDLIISNLFLTGIAMGQISIVKTISALVTTMYQLFASPFQPTLLKKYGEKDINGVVAVINGSMKLNGFISALLFAGFVSFGDMYFKLWTPSQDPSVLHMLTIITFLGSISEGIAFPMFYTYTLTLKNKFPCLVTIISGLLNVAGMFILIKFYNFGAVAVVLTTTVIGWGNYFIFTPIYSARCLGRSPKVYFTTIARILITGTAMTLCVRVVRLIELPTSWLSLLCYALVSTAVCIPVYLYGVYSKSERITVYRKIPFIKKFIRR